MLLSQLLIAQAKCIFPPGSQIRKEATSRTRAATSRTRAATNVAATETTIRATTDLKARGAPSLSLQQSSFQNDHH